MKRKYLTLISLFVVFFSMAQAGAVPAVPSVPKIENQSFAQRLVRIAWDRQKRMDWAFAEIQMKKMGMISDQQYKQLKKCFGIVKCMHEVGICKYSVSAEGAPANSLIVYDEPQHRIYYKLASGKIQGQSGRDSLPQTHPSRVWARCH